MLSDANNQSLKTKVKIMCVLCIFSGKQSLVWSAVDKQIGQFRKQSRSVEILKAWGPSFSRFPDLGLSWGFCFCLCLRITFIFLMNRNILIHESFGFLWGLLSGSCSLSFCPEVPFLRFSEFCYWWCDFSWDTVNFHRKLGGDAVSTADPNWPNAYSIPWDISLCSWGSLIAAQEWAGHGRTGDCTVYHALCMFILSVVLLLFSSFIAVLLNCLYPNPQPVLFLLFFPIPPAGRSEWAPCGFLLLTGLSHDIGLALVWSGVRNTNVLIATLAG